ncbi:unnamed protein product [Cyprideis torosa]|uniref:Uncharacterized protein n=1 Tax=Cyprideis torosa TaxID=163714 RepID=A0A7R8W9G6_9CRUS|nr:unnamed protein product [Cyprideis torosa]CAG0884361.1 unnamed protein product [Cyprideis torosa]
MKMIRSHHMKKHPGGILGNSSGPTWTSTMTSESTADEVEVPVATVTITPIHDLGNAGPPAVEAPAVVMEDEEEPEPLEVRKTVPPPTPPKPIVSVTETKPSSSPVGRPRGQGAKDKNQLVCKPCGKTFLSRHQLRKHEELHIPRLACPLCVGAEKRSFEAREDLADHISARHKIHEGEVEKYLYNSPRHSITYNIEGQEDKDALAASGSTVESTNSDQADAEEVSFKYTCKICDQMFTSYVLMCKHRRSVHGITDYRGRTKISPKSEEVKMSQEERFYNGINSNCRENILNCIAGTPIKIRKKNQESQEDPLDTLSNFRKLEWFQFVMPPLYDGFAHSVEGMSQFAISTQIAVNERMAQVNRVKGEKSGKAAAHKKGSENLLDYLGLKPVSFEEKSKQMEIQARRRQEPELSGDWLQPRVYICNTCNEQRTNLYDLLEHKWSSHKNVLSTHKEWIGPDPVPKELPSPRSEADQKIIDDFLQAPGSFKCSKCSVECPTRSALYDHIVSCAKIELFAEPCSVKKKKKQRWYRGHRRGLKRTISNSPLVRERKKPGRKPTGKAKKSILFSAGSSESSSAAAGTSAASTASSAATSTTSSGAATTDDQKPQLKMIIRGGKIVHPKEEGVPERKKRIGRPPKVRPSVPAPTVTTRTSSSAAVVVASQEIKPEPEEPPTEPVPVLPQTTKKPRSSSPAVTSGQATTKTTAKKAAEPLPLPKTSNDLGGGDFACAGCGEIFQSKSSVERHARKCPRNQQTQASHASGIGTSEASSRASSEPPTMRHTCPNCAEGFETLTTLVEHVNSCTQVPPSKAKKKKFQGIGVRGGKYIRKGRRKRLGGKTTKRGMWKRGKKTAQKKEEVVEEEEGVEKEEMEGVQEENVDVEEREGEKPDLAKSEEVEKEEEKSDEEMKGPAEQEEEVALSEVKIEVVAEEEGEREKGKEEEEEPVKETQSSEEEKGRPPTLAAHVLDELKKELDSPSEGEGAGSSREDDEDRPPSKKRRRRSRGVLSEKEELELLMNMAVGREPRRAKEKAQENLDALEMARRRRSKKLTDEDGGGSSGNSSPAARRGGKDEESSPAPPPILPPAPVTAPRRSLRMNSSTVVMDMAPADPRRKDSGKLRNERQSNSGTPSAEKRNRESGGTTTRSSNGNNSRNSSTTSTAAPSSTSVPSPENTSPLATAMVCGVCNREFVYRVPYEKHVNQCVACDEGEQEEGDDADEPQPHGDKRRTKTATGKNSVPATTAVTSTGTGATGVKKLMKEKSLSERIEWLKKIHPRTWWKEDVAKSWMLLNAEGKHWLGSRRGQMWLKTPGGTAWAKWQRSKEGKTWLKKKNEEKKGMDENGEVHEGEEEEEEMEEEEKGDERSGKKEDDEDGDGEGGKGGGEGGNEGGEDKDEENGDEKEEVEDGDKEKGAGGEGESGERSEEDGSETISAAADSTGGGDLRAASPEDSEWDTEIRPATSNKAAEEEQWSEAEIMQALSSSSDAPCGNGLAAGASSRADRPSTLATVEVSTSEKPSPKPSSAQGVLSKAMVTKMQCRLQDKLSRKPEPPASLTSPIQTPSPPPLSPVNVCATASSTVASSPQQLFQSPPKLPQATSSSLPIDSSQTSDSAPIRSSFAELTPVVVPSFSVTSPLSSALQTDTQPLQPSREELEQLQKELAVPYNLRRVHCFLCKDRFSTVVLLKFHLRLAHSVSTLDPRYIALEKAAQGNISTSPLPEPFTVTVSQALCNVSSSTSSLKGQPVTSSKTSPLLTSSSSVPLVTSTVQPNPLPSSSSSVLKTASTIATTTAVRTSLTSLPTSVSSAVKLVPTTDAQSQPAVLPQSSLIAEDFRIHCDLCDEAFDGLRKLSRHFARDHKGSDFSAGDDVTGPFQCPICNKLYAHTGSLSRHIKSKHREWTVENYIAESHPGMRVSRRNATGALVALECILKPPKKRVVIGTQSGKSFDCNHCGISFDVAEALRDHFNCVHKFASFDPPTISLSGQTNGAPPANSTTTVAPKPLSVVANIVPRAVSSQPVVGSRSQATTSNGVVVTATRTTVIPTVTSAGKPVVTVIGAKRGGGKRPLPMDPRPAVTPPPLLTTASAASSSVVCTTERSVVTAFKSNVENVPRSVINITTSTAAGTATQEAVLLDNTNNSSLLLRNGVGLVAKN